MNNERFAQLRDHLLEYAVALGEAKGREYAHMNGNEAENRFKNFETAAMLVGLKSPGQSIMDLMVKSLMSISNYVQNNCLVSMNESPIDRFADLINYTILLYGWTVEQEERNEYLAYHGTGDEQEEVLQREDR